MERLFRFSIGCCLYLCFRFSFGIIFAVGYVCSFLTEMVLIRSIPGILFLLFLTCHLSVGQQITLLDQGTGQPVENVALFNKDKSVSTLSDAHGKANIGAFAETDSIFLQH